MAVTTTIYPKSVTWNSVTFDATTNGLIRIDITHDGQDIQDRVADQEYPMFTAIVNKACSIRMTCRQWKQVQNLGDAKSNFVATGKSDDATTLAITAAGMILKSVEPAQGRAEVGQAVLSFVHESADGSANPLS